MPETERRGGARPGAGRPKGRRDSKPRAAPRQQIAISAALLEEVKSAATREGITSRAWTERAIISELRRAEIDVEAPE